MTESSPSKLHLIRRLLWVGVGFAVVAAAIIYVRTSHGRHQPPAAAKATLGGPFTLVGDDGKPFSSRRLNGKPYAIFFGFTRCGDVCPVTLARLVKLRREASANDTLNIVFVTIDPANDGPNEVGQYAELFNAPIIGLTGSRQQIDKVKKQYGIYAEPAPHAAMGRQFTHTGKVLLFDRNGHFADTVSPDEPDARALAKIRRVAD